MTTARRGTTAARTSAAGVLGVLTARGGLKLVAAPAAEATTYRYWTYWSGERPGTSAAWTFSSRGPASDVVKDGTVVGWRFAVTSQAGTTKPRASAGLAALCPDLADPVPDRTRVALVVDYGTASDAPPGQQPPLTDRVRVECLTVAGSRVTGATVLDAAGIAVRTENGLLCALDSYPRGECAPVVGSSTRPTASPSPKPTRSASAKPTAARTSASATSTSSSAPAPTRSSTAAPSTSSTASAAVVPSVSSSPTSTAPTPDETLPAVAGAPAAAEPEQSSGAGFVGGALLVAGIGAAAWWTSRRRGAA
jgi:hypothetical protein